LLRDGSPEILEEKGWEEQYKGVKNGLEYLFEEPDSENGWPIWDYTEWKPGFDLKNMYDVAELIGVDRMKSEIDELSEEIKILIGKSIGVFKKLDGRNPEKQCAWGY
jgi:hypothetical protein